MTVIEGRLMMMKLALYLVCQSFQTLDLVQLVLQQAQLVVRWGEGGVAIKERWIARRSPVWGARPSLLKRG